VTLAERWSDIEAGLPADWSEVRLLLRPGDEAEAERAAALLAPLLAARHGREVRFFVAQPPETPSATLARRLLERLDREGIAGRLKIDEVVEAPAPDAEPEVLPALSTAWEAELANLPEDWSDLVAEVEVVSSDYLEPAAMLLAPLNPSRVEDRAAFRFRCARRFGYGASPGMARRCLERLDEEGITGSVRILYALSATDPVATQGPVWYVGGKVV
jgi:hypothetical protein